MLDLTWLSHSCVTFTFALPHCHDDLSTATHARLVCTLNRAVTWIQEDESAPGSQLKKQVGVAFFPKRGALDKQQMYTEPSSPASTFLMPNACIGCRFSNMFTDSLAVLFEARRMSKRRRKKKLKMRIMKLLPGSDSSPFQHFNLFQT